MESSLTVRRYRPTDAAAVLAVREQSLLAHGWEFDTNDTPENGVTDEYLGISSGILRAGGEFLVGVEEGDVVAIGGFKRRSESTAELVWMGVDPTRQRHGHGARILAALEARAAAAGCTRVELETFERLTAARRLYKSHGYVEVRRETDERTGDDRFWYEKSLGTGDR